MERPHQFLTHRLSSDELRQVEALFDAIIPPDAALALPGARKVGAADCLQRMLALDESLAPDAGRWHSVYRMGLAALDRIASEREGAPLAMLEPDAAGRLLSDLAAARLESMPDGFDQKAFFTLLRDHCIQGCFSDPRWGGNRDEAMWKWFGYLHEGR